MPGFHVITALWGKDHVRFFEDASLPTQVTEGNLLALRGLPGVRYRLVTTPAFVDQLRAMPLLRELSEIMPVDIVPVIGVQERAENTKYDVMSEFHRVAIVDAYDQDASMTFLGPETLYADGSFATLRRALADGKRVLLGQALHVVRECFFLNHIAKHGRGRPNAISSRELVGTAIDHLHAFHHYTMWDSPEFFPWPSLLTWWLGHRGIMMRGYHLHPYFLTPRLHVEPTGTIDDKYIGQVVPDPADWDYIQDSDDFVCVKMSRHAKAAATPLLIPPEERPAYVAEWAAQHTGEHHRRFVHFPIRYHMDDLDESWDRVEDESRAIVEDIAERLRTMPASPSPSPA